MTWKDNTDERVEEFMRAGLLFVTTPQGRYAFLKRAHSVGAAMPISVYWRGPGKVGSVIHPEWTTEEDARLYGRKVVCYSSWGCMNERQFLAMLLNFIDSGMPIHRMECGYAAGTFFSGYNPDGTRAYVHGHLIRGI